MRVLFVVEVRDTTGTFQPKIGFGQMDMLTKWMKKYLFEKMELYASEWRIVQYVPLVSSPNAIPNIN